MPLLLSNIEWKRINRYSEKDNSDGCNRVNLMTLTKASEEMTKKWPNSPENDKKRNEEIRKQKKKKNEKATLEFYKNYVMQKKEEHKQTLEEARLHMFKDKDAPKTLLSGLIAADVQHEWDKQIKFNRELREQAKWKKDAHAAEQKTKYQEWKEEQRNKALKKLQADIEFGNFIKEQARSFEEKANDEKAWDVEMERIDNIKARQQIEDIKNFEQAMKDKQKKNVMDAMDSSLALKRKKDREIEQREQLDEKLRNIYINSKHKIDCTRKDKELQMKNEKIRILEEISSRLEQAEEARDKKEQAILEKAREEHLQLERERFKAEKLRRQQLDQELKILHEQTVSEEARRKHEADTLHAWQMLNRIKNEELTEQFKEKKNEERSKKILEYRAELIAQWNERKELEARELAELRYFYGEKALRSVEEADKQFLEYANRTVQECVSKGRPLFPVEKVINNYKNKYRLNSMPETIKLENFERRFIPLGSKQPMKPGSPVESVPGSRDGIRNKPMKKTVQCKPCAPCTPPSSKHQLRKCAK